jgi:hypothetical protein
MAPLTGVVVTERIPVPWALAEATGPRKREKTIIEKKTAKERAIF